MKMNFRWSCKKSQRSTSPLFPIVNVSPLPTLWNFIPPVCCCVGCGPSLNRRWTARPSLGALCCAQLRVRVIRPTGTAVTGQERGESFIPWFLVMHREGGYFRERITGHLCLRTLFLCVHAQTDANTTLWSHVRPDSLTFIPQNTPESSSLKNFKFSQMLKLDDKVNNLLDIIVLNICFLVFLHSNFTKQLKMMVAHLPTVM